MSEEAPRSLGDLLGNAVRGMALDEGVAAGRLEDDWRVAAGTAAEATRPVKLRKGVLDVEVSSSALLAEIVAFRKDEILARLRETERGRGVRSIRYRLGEGDG